jgi:hypothetical protein
MTVPDPGIVNFLLCLGAVVGMALAVGLAVAGVAWLWGRHPPRPMARESDPPPVPLCHHCGLRLKPVLARMLPGQSQANKGGTPEGAAWFCDRCHEGPVYYAEPPGAKPPGVEEL